MKRGFLLFSAALASALIFSFSTQNSFGQAAAVEEAAAAAGAKTPLAPGPLSSGVSSEELDTLYERFGGKAPKLPEAPKPDHKPQKSAESAKSENELEETAEEKTAREAAEAAAKTETPEEKAAREAEEAKLANETPEEKTAREKAEADAAAGETIELELTAEHEAYIAQEIEAKTADLTKRATEAETKVAELEAKVQTLGTKGGPVPANIHPLFMVDDENAIAERRQHLTEFKAFAMEHFDGYESEDGKTVLTKEEIRKKLAAAEAELTQVIPNAQASLQMRRQWEPIVKKVYPELLDAKHPHYAVVQNILRACPNLRLFPNYMILIGDSLAGEKQRLSKNPPAGGKASDAKAKVITRDGKWIIVAKKPAPKAPVGSRPGNGSPLDRTQAKSNKGTPNIAGFVKAGAGRDALTATVAAMLA